MYLEFYKLKTKPFQISTDPRFLWMGEKHKEALAVLKYGILDNKGFLLLTGDVGTGKTTLLNALVDSLGGNVLVAMVTDPGLAKMDFFNFVADSFEMPDRFRSKGEFLIQLKNYLLALHGQGRQALLIIDECQHLNQKLLEEVRLLSNIEKHNTKLINIFFVGQNEFNEIILRPHNRAIRQRITINYNIEALTESETQDYIHFRLRKAGATQPIFTPRAIKAVHRFSNGYPRLINIICDQALLTGYVKESQRIGRQIVSECAEELKISHDTPIVKSRATPESIASASQEDARGNRAADNAPASTPRRPMDLNRALVMALIVVLIIWSGLVVAYFIVQNRPASTVNAAPSIELPARPPGKEGMSPTTHRPVSQTAHQSETTPSPVAEASTPTESDASTAITVKVPRESDQNAVGVSSPGAGGETVAATPPAVAEKVTDEPKETVNLATIEARFGKKLEIYFGFDANTFEDAAYPLLQAIAHFCIEHPDAKLILRGYSDNSGVRAYNVKLSEFRADMVKTYLIGRGVADSAIRTIAMGPIENASPQESMRKVVIEVVPPDAPM